MFARHVSVAHIGGSRRSCGMKHLSATSLLLLCAPAWAASTLPSLPVGLHQAGSSILLHSIADIEHKAKTEKLVTRVLSGKKQECVGIIQTISTHPHVDWNQLRQGRIFETVFTSNIPVLSREPTTLEHYKTYIMVGSVLLLLQALLIIGLLLQRTAKRDAESRLRESEIESENNFRMMLDGTPSLIWMCDKNGKVTYLNNRRVEFTGRDPSSGFDDEWETFIHPSDLDKIKAANSRGLAGQKGYSKEYQLRRHDGVYRWMLDVAAPRIDRRGAFAGFIGSAIDITDQKLANEAFETMSGRLIEAQERERSRIARELHDDICQRLALLSMELAQESLDSDDPSESRHSQMEKIRSRCVEIATDVQALSHELHSSKLEYLGVEAAIRSFCSEFSLLHNVEIDFTAENIPNSLPRDISLSLFRVTQEALHNAIKYSGEEQFFVDLERKAGDIQLEIRDAGAGFDIQGAARNVGLGLISMQERIHLVKGIFTVESKENCGTRILASVPFCTESMKSLHQLP
jgi:PAS domain S-box-containing protein